MRRCGGTRLRDTRPISELPPETSTLAAPAAALAEPAPVVVATARYVLLPLAFAITGYSVKAMERKIERGDWAEGKVWRRAPDGRIHLDVEGYQRWVESR